MFNQTERSIQPHTQEHLAAFSEDDVCDGEGGYRALHDVVDGSLIHPFKSVWEPDYMQATCYLLQGKQAS